MLSRFLLTMASSDDSTIAARCARASSVRFRSDTSRNTSTEPIVTPDSSLIGAALSSTGCSSPVPSDENGVVGQADYRAGLQGAYGWVVYELTGVLMDDSEHIGQQDGPGRPSETSLSATARRR